MKAVVGLSRCDRYVDSEMVLRRMMADLGGMAGFVQPGETILLKVNLLRAASPDAAVTTHPAVVAAVARMVREAGGRALIADSPGAGYRYNTATLERIYQKTGMARVAQETGARLNFDTTHQVAHFPEGHLIKRFEIIQPALVADGMINLCKLKTHLFTRMTGAVKNHFGLVPGLAKPGYHAKLQESAHFMDMLLDLSIYAQPRFNIMDAVVAMEGDGPGSGTPRPLKTLLAGRNALALDLVAAHIMGLAPGENPLVRAARKQGLKPTRMADIEIVGDSPDDLRVGDLQWPGNRLTRAGLALSGGQKWISPLFKSAMSVRPQVDPRICTACGACRKTCPVDAVEMVAAGYAHIDDQSCIRCYCCHEMCPTKAIDLKQSWLYRLLNR